MIAPTVADESTSQRSPASTRQSADAGAVVLGSDYRALGVVRSLGRRNIPVWVLAGGDDVLATRSRYATRTVAMEGATDDEQCAFLLRLARDHDLNGWTLYPSADESAATVARQHDQLARHYLLTTPPWEIFRWAYDKSLTYEIADRLGLPYPRVWTAATAAEAASLPIQFPAILKPAVKQEFNKLTAAKAWRIDDAAELTTRFDEAAGLVGAEHLLIQELVAGGGDAQFSVATICEEGQLLATVVARRTRQYPPDFGRASTFVETIDRPEIVEPAARLLREIRFTGLVEVEFKQDPRDGSYKLLDVNPRVWGWHTLCQRAGVDFPYLAWRLARGESVPQAQSAPGFRWLRLSTDLPTSLREMARGRLTPRTYLASLRGPRESAIFARDDPRPGLSELPMLVGVLARRLLHGDAV
jgi:D-aspartate ligase